MIREGGETNAAFFNSLQAEEVYMPEESVERRGAKWSLVVLFVSAVFAVLFMLGYFTNISKRGSVPINAQSPTSVNGNN